MKIISGFICILFMFSLVGCSSNTNQVSDSKDSETSYSDSEVAGNPFEDSDNTKEGSISHGLKDLNLDETGNLIPIVYNGDEISLNYYVDASGTGKNVGFLMFINGVAQPYKIDNSNADYEYMHIFELEEDNVEYPFTFIFKPNTGQKGETLDITIVSVYNAGFKPDMKETVSYGEYHSILPFSFAIEMQEDSTTDNVLPTESYGTINLSNESVTNELLDTLSNNGMTDIDMDMFNSEIFSLLYFDNVQVTDNLEINNDRTLHVKYMLCGHGGLEYTTSFYINNQPISSTDGKVSFNTTIDSGLVSVIEFDIDLEKLEDLNTFYIISVSTNAGDYPDDVFDTMKTDSIMLYK